MPKLYIDLTPARVLYVGTAAEVAGMAERVNQYLEALGFSDDMDQKHESPSVERLRCEIMGGTRL